MRQGKGSNAKHGRINQQNFTMGRIGCQRLIWTMLMGRQNYPKKQQNTVFSIIGGDFTGHCQFKKGFYWLSDIPTVFQEHIDKVLEFKTPVWLDDIICVTYRTIDEHEREVREVLNKLQNAGYRASGKKTELFKQELTWLG